jgi:dihydrofolate synthase/folylpolyglutamate synthase
MPAHGPSDLPGDPSYQQALEYLYGRINYERIVGSGERYSFRLQRISELLKLLGLSDYLHDRSLPPSASVPKVPLVHIAGTKGKGSTAAMVSAALTAAGLRTGLYTSPHLHRLEERFRVDSVPCSTDQLIDLVQRVAPAAAAIEEELGPPSFFELTTALAILHFDSSKCDAIVLEVGLGGRLDSTNVCSPSVSAITSIGLDHQHVLGETLTEIAAEKSGIIKPNVPVVSGVRDQDAAHVVAQVAMKQNSKLFQIDHEFRCVSQPAQDWGSELVFHGDSSPLSERIELTLQMEGDHQAANAGLAIAILDLLRDQGVSVSSAAVVQGLSKLSCIGRIERFHLPSNVLGIVDAAHNQDSIAALCETLNRRCSDRSIAVIFGTSIDKDAETMLTALTSVTDQIVLTRFWGNPRFQPTDELVRKLPPALRSRCEVIQDPVQACAAGLKKVTPGGTLVACGSFFLAAETREWFQTAAKN